MSEIDYEFMYNKALREIDQLNKQLENRKGLGMEIAELKSKLKKRDNKKDKLAKQVTAKQAYIDEIKALVCHMVEYNGLYMQGYFKMNDEQKELINRIWKQGK